MEVLQPEAATYSNQDIFQLTFHQHPEQIERNCCFNKGFFVQVDAGLAGRNSAPGKHVTDLWSPHNPLPRRRREFYSLILAPSQSSRGRYVFEQASGAANVEVAPQEKLLSHILTEMMTKIDEEELCWTAEEE